MLEVRLTHRFGGFALDVEFAAPAGVTALFGRSGSGKTSVVEAVAGLLRPDAGRIVSGGRVLYDSARGVDVPVHRRGVGYVFQDARLFPHLTVAGNLAYAARVTGARVDMAPVVAMLGLEALLERRPGALSGGEAQRVAIGRALLAGPAVLLMDEPLAALDEARKAEILPYVERLRDAAVPILYVSHSLAEVARLATTIVVLEAGRVVRAGDAAVVLADPAAVPALGLRDAGAVITARIAGHEADGLTRLETVAGPIWLPRLAAVAGTALRVRIAAQDVILARGRPEGLSALNILPGVVSAVRTGEGPGALVQIALGQGALGQGVGGEFLLARVTRRSAMALGLAEGVAVHAVLKSVAVAQADIGAG